MAILLIVGIASRAPWILAGVILVGAWWFVTWLLAPYSRTAFRLRQPGPREFERYRALARRIERIPIIGKLFRAGDELSGHAGGKLSTEYEQWVTTHGIEEERDDK